MATKKRIGVIDRIVIALAVANIGVILFSWSRPIHPVVKDVSAILPAPLLVYVLWANHRRKRKKASETE